MGVLGWGYDQTLDAPMAMIERALRSRHKLISDIISVFTQSPNDDAPPGEPGALMASLKSLAQQHNIEPKGLLSNG